MKFLKSDNFHLPYMDLATKKGRTLAFLLYGALPVLVLAFAISFALLSPGSGNQSGVYENADGSQKDNTAAQKLTEAQKKFDTYLNTIFATQASVDTLSEHYITENPEHYGIRSKDTTWGPATVLEFQEADRITRKLFDHLTSYDFSGLTNEQKLCYQLIETLASYDDNSESEDTYLYGSVFSPTVGVQAQIPVLLAEYAFDSEEDIENYLSLIELLPDYFTSLLTLQQARISFGIPLPAALADRICAQCESVAGQGTECFLLEVFEEKLRDFSDDIATLSDEDIKSYIDRHELLIYSNYLPAYRLLADNLAAFASEDSEVLGLSHYMDGKAYYEKFAQEELGTTRTMQEYISMTDQKIQEDLQNIYLLLAKDNTLAASLLSLDGMLPSGTPEEMLESLSQKMLDDFPALPGTHSYSIKYVHSALEPFLSPAFYLIPQIDSSAANTIYLNNAYMDSGDAMFTTLAHEGFPGHLYQTVAFYETNPHPVRQLYACNGYVEGWATYVEQMSYHYMDLPENLASLLSSNSSFTLGLYARIDMGVNYNGWLKEDVAAFLDKYGISSEDYCEDIYYTMVEEPGNYLKYYLGYLEFLELRKFAEETEGADFSLKDFHEKVLKLGPLPFSLLRTYF